MPVEALKQSLYNSKRTVKEEAMKSTSFKAEACLFATIITTLIIGCGRAAAEGTEELTATIIVKSEGQKGGEAIRRTIVGHRKPPVADILKTVTGADITKKPGPAGIPAEQVVVPPRAAVHHVVDTTTPGNVLSSLLAGTNREAEAAPKSTDSVLWSLTHKKEGDDTKPTADSQGPEDDDVVKTRAADLTGSPANTSHDPNQAISEMVKAEVERSVMPVIEELADNNASMSTAADLGEIQAMIKGMWATAEQQQKERESLFRKEMDDRQREIEKQEEVLYAKREALSKESEHLDAFKAQLEAAADAKAREAQSRDAKDGNIETKHGNGSEFGEYDPNSLSNEQLIEGLADNMTHRRRPLMHVLTERANGDTEARKAIADLIMSECLGNHENMFMRSSGAELLGRIHASANDALLPLMALFKDSEVIVRNRAKEAVKAIYANTPINDPSRQAVIDELDRFVLSPDNDTYPFAKSCALQLLRSIDNRRYRSLLIKTRWPNYLIMIVAISIIILVVSLKCHKVKKRLPSNDHSKIRYNYKGVNAAAEPEKRPSPVRPRPRNGPPDKEATDKDTIKNEQDVMAALEPRVYKFIPDPGQTEKHKGNGIKSWRLLRKYLRFGYVISSRQA